MLPRFAPPETSAIPIYVIPASEIDAWCSTQPTHHATWIRACGFHGKLGQILRLPNVLGEIEAVLFGWGTPKDHEKEQFVFAKAAEDLKSGTYYIASGLPKDALAQACLGWLLAQYGFDRYGGRDGSQASLVAPEGIDTAKLEAIAAGEWLTRDLINTPTNDMGPNAIEEHVHAVGDEFGAKVQTIKGKALLEQNFPLIHAVGRASAQIPRLIALTWGQTGPLVTLVGKGVCFDTGGLNLKPSSAMGLMKKDMGGAASVLGLARMIMGCKLPIRLRVLIPAVENSVSAEAFRPGDILTSRSGQTIEINNTDAEGRLILADALSLADENAPDVLVSIATLTGAARVALGPELSPFYTDDLSLASHLMQAGAEVADPLWHMPLYRPYEHMIEPEIANLDNAPAGGMAGSITAALFLDRFVKKSKRFVHFDIYGWSRSQKPARPKGGLGQGARALFEALPRVLTL